MHHIFAIAYTLFLSNAFISSARLKLAEKIKQGVDYSLSARALSSGGGAGCSGGVRGAGGHVWAGLCDWWRWGWGWGWGWGWWGVDRVGAVWQGLQWIFSRSATRETTHRYHVYK